MPLLMAAVKLLAVKDGAMGSKAGMVLAIAKDAVTSSVIKAQTHRVDGDMSRNGGAETSKQRVLEAKGQKVVLLCVEA